MSTVSWCCSRPLPSLRRLTSTSSSPAPKTRSRWSKPKPAKCPNRCWSRRSRWARRRSRRSARCRKRCPPKSHRPSAPTRRSRLTPSWWRRSSSKSAPTWSPRCAMPKTRPTATPAARQSRPRCWSSSMMTQTGKRTPRPSTRSRSASCGAVSSTTAYGPTDAATLSCGRSQPRPASSRARTVPASSSAARRRCSASPRWPARAWPSASTTSHPKTRSASCTITTSRPSRPVKPAASAIPRGAASATACSASAPWPRSCRPSRSSPTRSASSPRCWPPTVPPRWPPSAPPCSR